MTSKCDLDRLTTQSLKDQQVPYPFNPGIRASRTTRPVIYPSTNDRAASNGDGSTLDTKRRMVHKVLTWSWQPFSIENAFRTQYKDVFGAGSPLNFGNGMDLESGRIHCRIHNLVSSCYRFPSWIENGAFYVAVVGCSSSKV